MHSLQICLEHGGCINAQAKRTPTPAVPLVVSSMHMSQRVVSETELSPLSCVSPRATPTAAASPCVLLTPWQSVQVRKYALASHCFLEKASSLVSPHSIHAFSALPFTSAYCSPPFPGGTLMRLVWPDCGNPGGTFTSKTCPGSQFGGSRTRKHPGAAATLSVFFEAPPASQKPAAAAASLFFSAAAATSTAATVFSISLSFSFSLCFFFFSSATAAAAAVAFSSFSFSFSFCFSFSSSAATAAAAESGLFGTEETGCAGIPPILEGWNVRKRIVFCSRNSSCVRIPSSKSCFASRRPCSS
mmetsp:Transcript_24622/g.39670  ORF Transcript_24622/g.39670 Transcript_24622/m.39670 type:complete len:301 (-) Transcript_24622:96-998(-)